MPTQKIIYKKIGKKELYVCHGFNNDGSVTLEDREGNIVLESDLSKIRMYPPTMMIEREMEKRQQINNNRPNLLLPR